MSTSRFERLPQPPLEVVSRQRRSSRVAHGTPERQSTCARLNDVARYVESFRGRDRGGAANTPSHPPSGSAHDDLRRDLASGEWDRRYGHLRTTPEYDVGLRLITAEL